MTVWRPEAGLLAFDAVFVVRTRLLFLSRLRPTALSLARPEY